jgi:enoyl-CoA hydratase/carnithine racemase
MTNPASTPPTSYASLPFSQISLSHHPTNSPAATPVIILTINRAEKQNAFTTVMCNEMVSAFEMLDLDDRVKAIVVTGEGKMFCAGADLIDGLHRKNGEKNKEHRDTYVSLLSLDLP